MSQFERGQDSQTEHGARRSPWRAPDATCVAKFSALQVTAAPAGFCGGCADANKP